MQLGISFMALSEIMTRVGIKNHCTKNLQNLRMSLIYQIWLSCQTRQQSSMPDLLKKTKDLALEQLQTIVREKPLHGQYPKRLRDNDGNEVEANKWLSTSGLKSEIGGIVIAAQDQYLRANYNGYKILEDGTSPMCRVCSKH